MQTKSSTIARFALLGKSFYVLNPHATDVSVRYYQNTTQTFDTG